MQRRSERGFTMVEVLVALVLSMIAMVGVIALYRSQSAASSFSRRNTEATILAEDQMERLRATGGAGSGTVANLDERGVVVTGGPFTRFFEVTNPTATSFYDDILVRVSWIEEGLTKSVSLRGKRNR
jgi:Tfp pilus assembly protein PilV